MCDLLKAEECRRAVEPYMEQLIRDYPDKVAVAFPTDTGEVGLQVFASCADAEAFRSTLPEHHAAGSAIIDLSSATRVLFF